MARIELIDSLKGYAIILVLFGHVIVYANYPSLQYTTSWLFIFIYSFHMPLLFFLSGYLVYQKPISSNIAFIWKKLKGLIFPYLVWVFIQMIILYIFVFHKTIVNKSIIDEMIVHLTLWTSLWFLPALFVSIMVLLFYINFKKLVPSKVGEIIILISFSACYIASWIFMKPGMFAIYLITWFSPFVLIGYIVAEHKIFFTKYAHFSLSAIMVYILLLPSWSPKVINWLAEYKVLIINFILAITGIIVAYMWTKSLKETVLSKFLIFCGVYSLEIYIVSELVSLFSRNVFSFNFWIGTGLIAYISGSIVLLASSIILSLIFSYNKYISLILFGRWSPQNFNFYKFSEWLKLSFTGKN